jgi:rhamnose utilization protein RhaD (predicted bifunctional aldolase and dehydrogenase)
MGESVVTPLPSPVCRWDPIAARGLTGRDEVVYRSHLVGSDPALTREGGGNFSAKGTVLDHCGRETEVLWMSAWGCDGATTTPDDFPALRLGELNALRDCGPLSESQMIERVLACGLRGEQPRPGIETLTHAFLKARHVDHSHPDAVIALTAIPDGRERAEAEFGDEAIWFDYRQFDIDVARELADRVDAQPSCRFVLLANHGLFTWAQTSEECYMNSLEAVARANRALDKAIHRPADLGGRRVEPLPPDRAADLLAGLLPVMRGALSEGNPGVVLHVDRGEQAVAFSSSVRGPRLSQAGPACPDSLLTVGYRPLVLDPVTTADDAARDMVLRGIEGHRRWYRDYYERHITEAGRALGLRDDAPGAIVLPGVGVVTKSADAAKARLCADHFGQTMSVIRAADAAGGYTSISEARGLADEYWPLMRFKPQLQTEQARLTGKVMLVTGAEDERALVLAGLLAAEGAHVALEGRSPAAVAAAAELAERYGERKVVALPGDGERPRDAVREAVLTYGGLDVLIDMTPSGATGPEVLPVFARQGRGGSILLAGAERTADDLRSQIARMESAPLPDGTTVNAVTHAAPEVLFEAVLFFTGRAAGAWRNTVLEAHEETAGRTGR